MLTISFDWCCCYLWIFRLQSLVHLFHFHNGSTSRKISWATLASHIYSVPWTFASIVLERSFLNVFLSLPFILFLRLPLFACSFFLSLRWITLFMPWISALRGDERESEGELSLQMLHNYSDLKEKKQSPCSRKTKTKIGRGHCYSLRHRLSLSLSLFLCAGLFFAFLNRSHQRSSSSGGRYFRPSHPLKCTFHVSSTRYLILRSCPHREYFSRLSLSLSHLSLAIHWPSAPRRLAI